MPNHSATPFQTDSHGVLGMRIPTSEIICDPLGVKSCGYSPRILPPFMLPDATK